MSQHQKNSVRKLVSKSLPKSNGEPINGSGKVERNQPKVHPNRVFAALNPRSRLKKIEKPQKSKTTSIVGRVINDNHFSTTSESLLTKIVDTGKSVISDVSKIASSDPTVLLTAPSTLMKVVDVTSGIIKSVKGDDSQKKMLSGPVVSGKDEQILRQVAKVQPVINTTILPTSTSTNVSIPKMISTPFISEGRRGMHLTGSYLVGNVFSYEDDSDCWWNPGIGGSLISGMNNSLFGERAYTFFQLFQKIRFNSVTLTFIPQRGTDYVGNIMLSILDGIDQPTGGAVSMSTVSQRDNVLFSDLKTPSSLTSKGLGNWLWSNNTSTNDAKFFADQKIGVCVYNTANEGESPAVLIPCGQILVSYDVDLLSATEGATSLAGFVHSVLLRGWLNCDLPQLKFDTYLLMVSIVSSELEKRAEKSPKDLIDLMESCLVQKPYDFDGKFGKPVSIFHACDHLATKTVKKQRLVDDIKFIYDKSAYAHLDHANLIDKFVAFQTKERGIEEIHYAVDVFSILHASLQDAKFTKTFTDMLDELEITPENLFVNVIESILYFLRDFVKEKTWFTDVVTLIKKISYDKYRSFNPITLSQQLKLEEEYDPEDNWVCNM